MGEMNWPIYGLDCSMLDKRLWEALTQEAVMSEPMTGKRLQWFKTLVAVHEPELGELFREIDRLRSAPAQPMAVSQAPNREEK